MRLVIAAGGTGGHLYPAIALAREFLRQDPSTAVRFIGTARGIEVKVLPHEGFELTTITALPVMGLGPRQALLALRSLPKGMWESLRILKHFRPDLVMGIGGYTTPPVLVAAALLRIPRVILEPNAYPGKANTMLGPLADRVFVAFEAAARHFKASKVRVLGVPVRRAFLESGKPGPTTDPRRALLVFGGSRGAHAINLAMMEALPMLMKDPTIRARLAVIHQTGEADYERVLSSYQAAGIQVDVVPFLFDMPEAFRAADLVVSRAGAMTLAELTVCGKPAVLIPFPHAIYQHQAHNARVLETAGAAVVVPQGELTGARLAQTVGSLLRDPEQLHAMSERSRSIGKIDAAEAIVRECLMLAKQGSGG